MSVQMPSMPHDANSTARATSLHVHVFTCRPASWQRSIIARSTVGSHGWMAAWPALTAQAIDVVGDGARSSATPWRSGDRGRGSDRSSRGGTTRSATSPIGSARPPSSATTASAMASVGSKSASPGRFLISMLTMRSGARVEGGRQRRDVGGKLVAAAADERPPVGEHRIVVDDEGFVGGASGVELDRPGTGLDRRPERLDGVLPSLSRRPTMGDHQDHGATLDELAVRFPACVKIR